MALDVRLHGRDGSAMHRTDSILDVLVRLFCDSLWKALHQGPARRYEVRDETLALVRGRIDIAQQARRNLGRPDRIACTFEEFTEDTPLNQILKATLRLLIGVVRSADNQRDLTELLFCLADVSDVPRQSLDWHRASTNRLTSRFAPLLRMARTFLDGASSDVLSGSDQGFALLFDMNVLFEEYIGRVLQRAFAPAGLDVRRQGPVRHLVLNQGGAPAFKLRPDAVAMRGSRVSWIVDTKWKRLSQLATREGVAAADMYQMSIYARQYQAAHVMLLYPHHAELAGNAGLRAGYSLLGDRSTDGAAARISVATIDLRDLASVPDRLQALLGEQAAG
ncbi:MAG: hypothetical protein JSR41_08455 [Proteobacteria bacterium]|nr:hypothetical protein [Pseudomonadota bacterium]